jgi:hypothetical protein
MLDDTDTKIVPLTTAQKIARWMPAAERLMPQMPADKRRALVTDLLAKGAIDVDGFHRTRVNAAAVIAAGVPALATPDAREVDENSRAFSAALLGGTYRPTGVAPPVVRSPAEQAYFDAFGVDIVEGLGL